MDGYPPTGQLQPPSASSTRTNFAWAPANDSVSGRSGGPRGLFRISSTYCSISSLPAGSLRGSSPRPGALTSTAPAHSAPIASSIEYVDMLGVFACRAIQSRRSPSGRSPSNHLIASPGFEGPRSRGSLRESASASARSRYSCSYSNTSLSGVLISFPASTPCR